jgi:hypothetical protein
LQLPVAQLPLALVQLEALVACNLQVYHVAFVCHEYLSSTQVFDISIKLLAAL